jgi:hypothetical protein
VKKALPLVQTLCAEHQQRTYVPAIVLTVSVPQENADPVEVAGSELPLFGNPVMIDGLPQTTEIRNKSLFTKLTPARPVTTQGKPLKHV